METTFRSFSDCFPVKMRGHLKQFFGICAIFTYWFLPIYNIRWVWARYPRHCSQSLVTKYSSWVSISFRTVRVPLHSVVKFLLRPTVLKTGKSRRLSRYRFPNEFAHQSPDCGKAVFNTSDWRNEIQIKCKIPWPFPWCDSTCTPDSVNQGNTDAR